MNSFNSFNCGSFAPGYTFHAKRATLALELAQSDFCKQLNEWVLSEPWGNREYVSEELKLCYPKHSTRVALFGYAISSLPPLPSWTSELHIHNCPTLRVLSCNLSSIKRLKITQCPDLEIVSSPLQPEMPVFKLDVDDCPNLKEVFKWVDASSFHVMNFMNCPELVSVPQHCSRSEQRRLLASCPSIKFL